MKLALEALESCGEGHISDGGNQWHNEKLVDKAIAALQEALAGQPAQQQEPVVCMKCGVQLGGLHLATGDGSCPFGWLVQRSDCAPQPPVQQEPTKAMIDAAERIDWSDSDVRGNIVNMWQAMCAVAPQPAQRKPLTDEQIKAMIPSADGSAEANKRRVEVLPGVMGTEFDEVDAWSMPLVLQIARAIEAAHGIKDQP